MEILQPDLHFSDIRDR